MKLSLLPAAPAWAVPVRASFLALLFAGVGWRRSWLLSRGALVSPFAQSALLLRARWWALPLSLVPVALRAGAGFPLFAPRP